MSCYGENLSFHCQDAKEVMLQMIIDDGVPGRGHRANVFNPAFNVMGCFTCPHSSLDQMTCIDYAGSFVPQGEPGPLEEQLNAFLKEEVKMDMPDGVASWKQNSKIKVVGSVAQKTVERILKMKDGSE